MRWIGLTAAVTGLAYLAVASSDAGWVHALSRPWWDDPVPVLRDGDGSPCRPRRTRPRRDAGLVARPVAADPGDRGRGSGAARVHPAEPRLVRAGERRPRRIGLSDLHPGVARRSAGDGGTRESGEAGR